MIEDCMETYTISHIKWDKNKTLPTSQEVKVPNYLNDGELEEFIANHLVNKFHCSRIG